MSGTGFANPKDTGQLKERSVGWEPNIEEAFHMTSAILRSGTWRSRLRGSQRRRELDPGVFGKKFGVVSSLLGCWHANLSRPFGHGEMTYRSCLDCGARTPFNPETLTTLGKFYRSPAANPLG